MQGLARAFRKDERGIALILVSIMLPVIVGFALLAIDMSRANNLHNDLQKAADAFAIAAAAELDGMPDAHTRATRALANLVDNSYRFSTAGVQTFLTDAGITPPLFLKSIPASDSIRIDPSTGVDANGKSHLSAGPAETRFILVNVNPTGFASIFPASFLTDNTSDNNFTIGATAVAGFGSGVCDFTPLFICNPFEGSADSLAEIVQNVGLRRRMIEMKKKGGNTAHYFPGNYGLLQTPNGSNATPAIIHTIASSKPEACYSSDGVDTRPGNPTPTKNAFNVRFDIYEGAHIKNNENNPDYRPGSNVIKGYKRKSGSGTTNNCNMELDTSGTRKGLPPDTCLATSCSTGVPANMDGRIGDGYWDFQSYWSTNHPSTTAPNGWSNANPPSRYDVYRYEITNKATLSWGPEDPAPGCYSGDVEPEPERRLIYGAILNCNALAAAGYKMSGQTDDLPVVAFGSFFLTEPVGDDDTLRAELVDITGKFGNGTLTTFQRDEVQLYR